jgi:carbon monoxide dehydrogenase subunit G
MVVRVERVVTVPASPEEVWEYIADPAQRADAISVVKAYEPRDDGSAIWRLKLPLPVTDRTIAVETRDRTRDSPTYVEFVGTSKILRVKGEHELEATDDGTKLTNRFIVDGKIPGVEKYFKRNMDDEFDNLERGLIEYLDLTH